MRLKADESTDLARSRNQTKTSTAVEHYGSVGKAVERASCVILGSLCLYLLIPCHAVGWPVFFLFLLLFIFCVARFGWPRSHLSI